MQSVFGSNLEKLHKAGMDNGANNLVKFFDGANRRENSHIKSV
jgi:hypothetical protein